MLPWSGRIFFGADLLVYAGSIAPTELHAHPTMQVTLAPGRDLVLADEHGRSVRGGTFVVPPRARHAIVAPSPRALVLHMALEGSSAKALRALTIDSSDARAWRAAGDACGACEADVDLPASLSEAERAAGRILAALAAPLPRARPLHPAVRRTLARLPELLAGPIRLGELARSVGLSPSRLSHLFTAEVGTPLRSFILWMRLRRAAEQLASGATITRAAHAAGFVDGAHLAHVYKRTFGLSPTALTADIAWFVEPAAAAYKPPNPGRTKLPHDDTDAAGALRTRARDRKG